MKYSLKQFLFLIICISIVGCVSVKLNKLNTYYTSIPDTQKTLFIPKYGPGHQFKGYPYIYWNFCKQKQKQLGLISPETSENPFIYRVWITNPTGRKNQPHGLIEIKCDSNKCSGKLVLMHVNFNQGNLSETIIDSKNIELTPKKTDWKTIIDNLMKLKIDILPTDDLIPNYYSADEGYDNNATTFSFEFATEYQYRFYQYSNIYRAPDKFWQSKNVIAILNLLEEEFKWDSIAKEYFK